MKNSSSCDLFECEEIISQITPIGRIKKKYLANWTKWVTSSDWNYYSNKELLNLRLQKFIIYFFSMYILYKEFNQFLFYYYYFNVSNLFISIYYIKMLL